MNLNEKPKSITRPSIHLAYVEKTGPFMKTAPKAWAELGRLLPKLEGKVTGKLSLFKVEAGKEILQAGAALAAKPTKLPKPLSYARVRGGTYARFVLTGPYSDLPMAWARVMDLVEEKRLNVRPSFCIENYVTDSSTTPEADTVTELLVPIRAKRAATVTKKRRRA